VLKAPGIDGPKKIIESLVNIEMLRLMLDNMLELSETSLVLQNTKCKLFKT